MYNRNELLYQVATLFYEENWTQTAIAKKLNISRPTIISLLKEARKIGMVTITIAPQQSPLSDYELQLAEKFNLQTVIVTKAEKTDKQSKINTGKAAAHFIEQRALELNSIGIGWGTTIFEMVQAANWYPLMHLNIVPLMGGASVENIHLHSNHLAFRLAERYQAKVHYFYAPAIADSARQKQELDNSSFIKKARQKALDVDLAVLSCGNPILSSTYKQLGVVSLEEEQAIRSSGIIGDVLSTFFDKNGHPVETDLSKRMVGVTLEELEMMNEILLIETGKDKALSLFALLKKGMVDHIIIDQPIAELLLGYDY